MDYPVEILPNPNYKIIDCAINDFFLARHIDNIANPHDLWDDITNTLKIKYTISQSDHIDDLSMILLSVFKIEYIPIKLTELGDSKYNKYCNPDENVTTPVFNDDFLLKENRHFWCVPMKRFQNEIFDFTSSDQPLVAKCIVKHTPMKWNFWHFSLHWEVYGNLLSSFEGNHRKNLAKKIGHSLKTSIAKFASIQNPTIPILNLECYNK